MKMNNKKVGTFTLGILLIVLGGVFLVANITNIKINIELLVSLWPVILLLLGGEVLYSYFFQKGQKLVYDFPASILIVIMGLFSITMAFIQILIENYPSLF